ncbi:hypothetical protein [Streptomyces sp. 891-h]|uniref:hypothetical protein n=1 Tax=unclassified Streptomyces TaxID=2593676 RepID=UPI001FAA7FA2|nr:hypothetical protein [Streptomyces sp. 891-h]UNZ20177.1 hypothetical protein HC362_27130 [Streptomyces sp. 891-h]
MQQDQSTTRDETTREPGTTVNVSRTVRRPDGPMGYGPHATSGDRDPESHIFRGED